ncbi:MAG: tetratricopeptide repeat protein [Akkermansia sp.]
MKKFNTMMLLFVATLPTGLFAQASNEAQLLAEFNKSRMESQAMYTLARTMLEEKSITDVSSVPALLQEAAAGGSIRAELLLLDVWEGKFKGLSKDGAKALALAELIANRPINSLTMPRKIAREQAQSEAMFRLALYKEKGIACKASPTDAFTWMCAANHQGHPSAKVELARYYMQGIGCERDYRRSIELLKEQDELDYRVPNLYFYLGYMCEQGLGLSAPRLSWALSCYEKGSKLGDARATNNLASMYERGAGIAKDYTTALRLYRHAAKLGNKDASVNMQRLAYLLDQQEDKKDGEPWYLRVNRGYLQIINSLPIDIPFAPEFKRWNRRMEERHAQSKG